MKKTIDDLIRDQVRETVKKELEPFTTLLAALAKFLKPWEQLDREMQPVEKARQRRRRLKKIIEPVAHPTFFVGQTVHYRNGKKGRWPEGRITSISPRYITVKDKIGNPHTCPYDQVKPR